MDIKEISDMVYSQGDREKMEEMNQVYYQMAEYIKEHDGRAYDRFKEEAEAVCYSLSDEEARDIVRAMRPYGEHWTRQDIATYIRERGEEGTNIITW